MRKNSHRRRIEAKAPMLVVMETVPELSLTERQSVEAYSGGWATTEHYDNLADCRDMLTMAAAERNDKDVLAICELAYHALVGIKIRYKQTAKMGVKGDELQALRALVETSEDFWKRQSGGVFETHYNALKRARALDKRSVA